MSSSTYGACLCGAVAFAIEPPYRWFAHCHCSLCRKQHGSLFGSSVGVAREQFRWLGGADDIVHYRASAAFERPFCRHCGSSVPAVSHDDRYWHVPAGLLDGDPGARPRSHIFVASRSPLYELGDTLPRHDAYPPGIDLPSVAGGRVPAMDGVAPLRGLPRVAGSCVCSAVAFAVSATPERLVNCYCSRCRRRSGAAFTSTLLAPTAGFRWLRGEARIRHYAMPATGAPRSVGAAFCADCGSPVPTTLGSPRRGTTLGSPRRGALLASQPSVYLPAGAIDSELPPLPAVHVYVGSKAPWVTITDAWPQFAELPADDPWKSPKGDDPW